MTTVPTYQLICSLIAATLCSFSLGAQVQRMITRRERKHDR